MKEALDVSQDIRFKVDTWMEKRPEEKLAFDSALDQWKSTHQLDDSLVQAFIDRTNVSQFINFVSDNINDNSPHDDDFDMVRNIIKNY